MKLIVITPEQDMPGELALVNDMFRHGLTRLHVRKRDYDVAMIHKYISSIDAIYHRYIVIHDHFELYNEFDLGGIHLNSMMLGKMNIPAGIPSGKTSTSFHSWQEIEDNTTAYGYVFISPVFDSISKAGYMAAIDLNGAAIIKKKLIAAGIYCPDIIGLGGVGEDQLCILQAHSFDGAAMLGAIWQSADPVATLQQAIATIKGH